MTSKSAARLLELGPAASAFVGDVTVAALISSVIDTVAGAYGRIDAVVANARISGPAAMMDLPPPPRSHYPTMGMCP